MFPFILSCLRKYKGINTSVIIITVSFAVQIIMAYLSSLVVQRNYICNDDFVRWFVYIFPLSRLEDFVIGCNLGFIFMHSQKNRDKKETRKGFTWLEIGIIMIIAAQWLAYVFLVAILEKAEPSLKAIHWWNHTVLWTLTSCALVYVFALNQGYISKILANKVVLFIGNLSANAFLIHQMVYRYLDTLENTLFGDTYNNINIFVCFILTMICAYFWEKITFEIRNKNKMKYQS
jgi:peptidoglycan/LPS O-acetylase OafA/YrhL